MLNYQRVSLGINLQSSDLCRCQIWQNGQMLRLCRKQSSPSQYRCLGRSLTNSADEFELVAAATALIRDREKATRLHALLVALLFLFRYVPFDLAMLWKLCEIILKNCVDDISVVLQTHFLLTVVVSPFFRTDHPNSLPGRTFPIAAPSCWIAPARPRYWCGSWTPWVKRIFTRTRENSWCFYLPIANASMKLRWLVSGTFRFFSWLYVLFMLGWIPQK